MAERAIIFRQILPNAAGPVIVTGSLMVATAMLMESASPSWGSATPIS